MYRVPSPTLHRPIVVVIAVVVALRRLEPSPVESTDPPDCRRTVLNRGQDGHISEKAAKKLVNNIGKQSRAGEELEAATSALMPVFQAYKRIGNGIVRAEFEAMKRAHAQVSIYMDKQFISCGMFM